MAVAAKRGSTETQKTSFRLPVDLLEAMRERVEEGKVESQTALVERALRRELAAQRRDELRAAYQRASEDEAFMADMSATSAAFESTTADGLT